MARYFQILEIDMDTFIAKTGEDLDCSQLIAPVDGLVYVGIDEDDEDEMCVSLDCFDD